MKSIFFTLLILLGVRTAHAIDVNFTFVAPTCHGYTDGTATANPSGGTAPYAYAWSNGQSGQTTLGIVAGAYSCTVTDQTGATVVGNVVVTQPAEPVAAITAAGPNCGGAYTPLTLSMPAGVGALTYIWSTGATTANIQPVVPGSIFATVTDANGCDDAVTYNIPVSSQIFTAYQTIAPACFGGNNGSIIPNIIGNYGPQTWNWSTGTASNQALQNVSAGAYSITISDANGCTKVESSVVPSQPQLQVLPEMTNALCHGTASGVGKALAYGGVGSYTYLWSTGSTDPIQQNLIAGSYTVTVTDGNGCTASATGIVTEPAILTNTVVSVTPSCGNTGSATVQPGGGTPPYMIVWNGGQANGPTISGVPGGNYYVCVIDANHCQLDLNVVIPGGPGLNVTMITEKAACVGVDNGTATAITTGGSGSYTYTWSNGAPAVAQIVGLAAGTNLSVTVTDLVTGCTGIATGFISTHSILIVQVTDTDVFCANNATGTATAMAANGTAPYTYVWGLPNGSTATGNQLTGLVAGAYPVTVTDSQGCSNVGVADINATSQLHAAFQLNIVECLGDSVRVQLVDQSNDPSSAINSWNWSIGWGSGSLSFNTQNPPAFVVPLNVTAQVILDISSAAGCTAQASGATNVAEAAKLNIVVTGNQVLCTSGGTAIATPTNGVGPFTYLWTLPGGGTSTTNPLPVAQAGIYQVLVTDANGCFAQKTTEVTSTSSLAAATVAQIMTCESDAVHIKLIDQSIDTLSQIVSWNWNVNMGTFSNTYTGQNPPIVPVPANTTGTVQLIVTSAAGCVSEITIPLAVTSAPQVQIDGGATAVNCTGGPVPIHVTANGTYTYNWLNTNNLTFVNNDPLNAIANPPATTTYALVATNGTCIDTLSVQVIRAPVVDVNLTDQVLTTCDPTTGLEPTFSIPPTNLDIKWLNSAGDSISNASSITVPGTTGVQHYTVIVTDVYGCSDSDDVTVNGYAVDVQATTIVSNTACEGTPLQGQVINNNPNDVLTYQWSTNNPALVISNPLAINPTFNGPAGTYTVTVLITNQHNCTKIIPTQVTIQPSASLAAAISSDLCNGLAVAFDNTTTVAGTWYFGDNSTSTLNDPSHNYAAAGQYIVTFIPDAAACIAPYTDTIQVQATPAVVAGMNSNLQSCLGTATFAFNNETQNNAPVTSWQWTFQPGGLVSTEENPIVTFTQAGTITATLVVTDINGCSDASEAVAIPVNIVNDTIAAATKVCPGDLAALNITGGNPLYTYTWTANPPDPTLNPNISNPVVAPAVPTTYSVQIVNGNCTVAQSILVSLNTAAAISAYGDTTICGMNLATIGANSTNGMNFEWSQSPVFINIFATTPTTQVMPANNGMNYVRTTTIDGCTGIDSVMVQLGLVSIEPYPIDPVICNAADVELTITNNIATDQLTYNWSNGLPSVANPTVNPTQNTTYSVTVTNQFGCTAVANFAVSTVNLQLSLSISGKDTICLGETAELLVVPAGGSTYTFDWSPAETLTSANTANPIAKPEVTTEYFVTVTDASGCTLEGSQEVVLMPVECKEPYLFVPQAFTPNGDNNNDFFKVRGVNIKELYFVVWDRWGEKIYETNDPLHTGWDGIFNGVASTPDSYAWYARVTCGNGATWTKKGNVTLLK